MGFDSSVFRQNNAAVAHQVEQQTENLCVAGSSPARGTKLQPPLAISGREISGFSGSIPAGATKFRSNCPGGGMVDTTDSKSVVERRAGSSPAWGTKLQ